jgi:hypothetical protein
MILIRLIILFIASLMFGNVASGGAYTEAYFPYNRRDGGRVRSYGFGRFYSNQRLDSFTRLLGGKQRARVYSIDFSRVTQRYGLMIWISDPNATITVMRCFEGHGRPEIVAMETLEVTPTYKIVDIMDPTLDKFTVIVTNPNKNSRFSINIMAICE